MSQPDQQQNGADRGVAAGEATDTDRIVTRLNNQTERMTERIDELEQTIDEQAALLNGIKNQNATLKRLLASDQATYPELDDRESFYDRVTELEETVADHEDRLELTLTADGAAGSPDERAMRIREVLFNRAKRKSREVDNDAMAELEVEIDRDACNAALAGDLHRGSALDAMKRAADGKLASISDAVAYNPINGSSDLQPIDGIAFQTGKAVNSRRESQQSHLVMSVGSLTRTDLRQNLTTVSSGTEGSR
jgi:uncharacterized coiled-coil protein SlyX